MDPSFIHGQLSKNDGGRKKVGGAPTRKSVWSGFRRGSVALAEEAPVLHRHLWVGPVHHGDEVDRDALRAGLLAIAVVGAGPAVLLHRLHHRLGAPPPLR